LTPTDGRKENPPPRTKSPKGEKTVLTLRTPSKAYYFCSLCKSRLSVLFDDGDVLHLRCPNRTDDNKKHESFLSYQTNEALRQYGLKILWPNIYGKIRVP
jgi:hypothetical protein